MLDAVLFAIGVAAIIAAAYYVTHFIGSRGLKMRSGRDIKLRDRFALSKDQSFAIIEVRGRVYIVALAAGGAALLDTYELTEYEERAPSDDASPKMSFRDALARSARDAGGIPGFIASRLGRRDGDSDTTADDTTADSGDERRGGDGEL
ncbi:MAG: flagellar biosynthetic protein FliO [Oscillospiraceae bacterium]|jgi:flagellar biogenesis protein FliO|nr:flagellar biosynthetic protein FliO [Oscillospiraceae bacterium]